MIPDNYGTIMFSYYLGKLYGMILKSKFNGGQRRMVAVQLDRQVSERGSQLLITH